MLTAVPSAPKRRCGRRCLQEPVGPWGLFCWARRRSVVNDTDDRQLRVLIAEDETIIRADLRGLLEDNGMAVCGEARDGREAVDLAHELEPDVAILDIRMPDLDGIEVCRRIYAERPIPVIMLTAFADRGLVDRALAAGAFTYLVRP